MGSRGVKDFLGKSAPAGYIAGLGRGAQGFVTRPDLGPGSSVAVPPIAPTAEDRPDDAENEEGLLAAQGPLGADDEEADVIFAEIEAKMLERRGGRRVVVAEKASNQNDPSLLFATEKLKLRQVTADEWAHLPESGDFIAKRAKKANEKERYTPVPDSVLVGSTMRMVDEDPDFRMVGEARERVLGARLDMAKVGENQQSIDPNDYLAGLDTQSVSSSHVNDIKRARTLLRSAVNTNPSNSAAWIAAARIEEVAGNIKQARAALSEALGACPDSEDIWIEAVRLAPANETMIILNRALERLPRAPQLWIQAAELEKDPAQATRVLRKGLEVNVDSTVLWKALVEREENPEDARVLLSKAVEACPNCPELWIALARLESHENARKILNKARQLNPASPVIWLAAAKLEEAHGNQGGIVQKIVARAVSELPQKGVVLHRHDWLQEAIQCEKSKDIACAEAIIDATWNLELDPQMDDFPHSLANDSEFARSENAFCVARKILDVAIEQNPHMDDLWLKRISLAENVKDGIDLYERALVSCPNSVDLWILYAKSSGNETIFKRALAVNPQSERLWMLAAKSHIEMGDSSVALNILEAASNAVQSEKIWKKRAKLELRLEKPEAAKKTLETGLLIFPASDILWLPLCQLDSTQWESALSACHQSAPIMKECASFFAESQPMRARAILERGRRLLPDSAPLWLASVQLELQLGSPSQAKSLLTRGLQKCPTDNKLWYTAITIEPRPLRKAKAMEAMKRCGNDALICMAIAQLMELERNHVSAREYYERAITADSNIGDIWAYFLLFIKKHDPEETLQLMEKIVSTQPKEGPKWSTFRKDPRWWHHPFNIIFKAFADSLEQSS